MYQTIYTCIFVILIASRVIWYTWKVIRSILKIWPPLDPCVTPNGKGPNHPKISQNIFWPITTSKPSITHFCQNDTWVLLPLQSSIVIDMEKVGEKTQGKDPRKRCKKRQKWAEKIQWQKTDWDVRIGSIFHSSIKPYLAGQFYSSWKRAIL